MHYYAINHCVKADGTTGHTDKFGTEEAMLYQYYLMCANASKNEDGDLFDSVEFGTIEGGKLKREVFDHKQAV